MRELGLERHEAVCSLSSYPDVQKSYASAVGVADKFQKIAEVQEVLSVPRIRITPFTYSYLSSLSNR